MFAACGLQLSQISQCRGLVSNLYILALSYCMKIVYNRVNAFIRNYLLSSHTVNPHNAERWIFTLGKA